ncbi:MAG: hydroxyacid dehydrogenase [Verrucomicrobia bacterium]|nr:hydroxyacid dehydrogenase [Verrucomicrobiota bacterium]
MSKPKILIDPQPRTVDLIFDAEAQRRLSALAELTVFDAGPMPRDLLEASLPEADILIGQTDLSRERLERAAKLRAIFNVEGNFLPNIDYEYCFWRGIRVLVASPAFATAVAEMALALALDLARGISQNDRAFRERNEEYGLQSNRDSFLFTGCRVGIIGFGDLGRAFRPLLYPFHCPVKVHDPWLPQREIVRHECTPCGLDELLASSDAVFVFASVTSENQGFLGEREFALIRPGGLFVLMSRAGVVDFGALTAAARSGRLKLATDVFPEEPFSDDHPIRELPNVVLSAHRSGGMREAFFEIGQLVLSDVELLLRGLPPLCCRVAQPETVRRLRSKPVTVS